MEELKEALSKEPEQQNVSRITGLIETMDWNDEAGLKEVFELMQVQPNMVLLSVFLRTIGGHARMNPLGNGSMKEII